MHAWTIGSLGRFGLSAAPDASERPRSGYASTLNLRGDRSNLVPYLSVASLALSVFLSGTVSLGLLFGLVHLGDQVAQLLAVFAVLPFVLSVASMSLWWANGGDVRWFSVDGRRYWSSRASVCSAAVFVVLGLSMVSFDDLALSEEGLGQIQIAGLGMSGLGVLASLLAFVYLRFLAPVFLPIISFRESSELPRGLRVADSHALKLSGGAEVTMLLPEESPEASDWLWATNSLVVVATASHVLAVIGDDGRRSFLVHLARRCSENCPNALVLEGNVLARPMFLPGQDGPLLVLGQLGDSLELATTEMVCPELTEAIVQRNISARTLVEIEPGWPWPQRQVEHRVRPPAGGTSLLYPVTQAPQE